MQPPIFVIEHLESSNTYVTNNAAINIFVVKSWINLDFKFKKHGNNLKLIRQ